jgi:hypothetical protein
LESRRPISAVYHNRRRLFVRTGWDGIRRGSSECFVISTAEKAKPA